MKNDKSLTNKIYMTKTIKKINQKIKLLGLSNKVKLKRFLTLRLIVCFVVLIGPIFMPYGVFYGPILAVIFWYGYEYLEFDLAIKNREKRLNEQAPFFFEVLIMTLESGRNLENALVLTADNIRNELGLEFKKSLSEIKVGKNLTEVLTSLKDKIPSDIINNIILNMIQAHNFGTSITDSIRIQLDYIREERILETKSNLNKLPMKVSIISVLILIPLTLIIILVPVFLNISKNNNNQNQISSSNR